MIHGAKELRHLLVEGDRLHEIRVLLAIIENIRRREDQIEGEDIHSKDELTHCTLIIGLCHLAISFKAIRPPPLEEEPNDTKEDDLVAILETDGVAAEFVLQTLHHGTIATRNKALTEPVKGTLRLEGDDTSIGRGSGPTAGVERERPSRTNKGFGLAILPSGGHGRCSSSTGRLQRIIGTSTQCTRGNVALLSISATGNEGTTKVRVTGRSTNNSCWRSR